MSKDFVGFLSVAASLLSGLLASAVQHLYGSATLQSNSGTDGLFQVHLQFGHQME